MGRFTMISVRSQDPLLSIRDLRISFVGARKVCAVDDVSFDLYPGTITGIVGESGCGKSVMALSILRLLEHTEPIKCCGEVLFDGVNLLSLPLGQMRMIRGSRIALVFQDPLSSLHPLFTVGAQIIETLRLHQRMSRKAAHLRAEELLAQVGIDESSRRLRQYPHELSGGLLQRVMIAMALAGEPQLLIADEPTTALDTTTQAQILDLLKGLQQNNMACLLISHDMGVVSQICSFIRVMYLGQIVEEAAATELFESPLHPYTQGLLAAIPPLQGSRSERLPMMPGQVEQSEDLGCHFAPRCAHAQQRCHETMPLLCGEGHRVRCFLAQEQKGCELGEGGGHG
jgi:peptide/nickel transport system ATP-binding protein